MRATKARIAVIKVDTWASVTLGFVDRKHAFDWALLEAQKIAAVNRWQVDTVTSPVYQQVFVVDAPTWACLSRTYDAADVRCTFSVCETQDALEQTVNEGGA